MRTPRVFTDQPIASGARITLEAGPSRHLLAVLRLRPGSALTVFNGAGGEFTAALVDGAGGRAHIAIGRHSNRERESPLAIHLGIGIARGERMDWVVQKAVELGVSAITPLFTERSEVRLNQERGDRKHRHWRQIAVSACEQCGRNRLPAIAKPVALLSWLGATRDLGLVLDPEAGIALCRVERPAGTGVHLLIGPEGGLTTAEIDDAVAAGFVRANLGSRILRTETAPLVAISLLQSRWGDLG